MRYEEWVDFTLFNPPTKGIQWQIFLRNGKQAVAWWDGKRFSVGYLSFENVTHWMSIPKPPKKAK